MDILSKHYEKIILIVCLIIMIVGLARVADQVATARKEYRADITGDRKTIDKSSGELVADFDPKSFECEEEWINRIRNGEKNDIVPVNEIAEKNSPEVAEDIISKWDRRYFSILTHHSVKPVELAEAEYRLKRNLIEQKNLSEGLKKNQAAIEKHIARKGDRETDDRLNELKSARDNYETELANVEVNISDLKKRIAYLGRFCTKQGSLVDPMELVCCSNPACGALILSNEDICPFCKRPLPEVNPEDDADGTDTDNDGIPDYFERAHMQKKNFLHRQNNQNNGMDPGAPMGMPGEGGGMTAERTPGVLNPKNSLDAIEDYDGDGFTNGEEFRYGTDIDDENDFPDPSSFIRIVSFDQDKVPFKFMGINDGKSGKDQKLTKWRAKLSFLRTNRWTRKDSWDPEDRWELVRIGKKFDAPNGKSYTLVDIDYEEVGGQKRAFAKIAEWSSPNKKSSIEKKIKKGSSSGENIEIPDEKTYVLYENEEEHFDQWYAQLIWMPSRSANSLQMIYNDQLIVPVGNRPQKIKTRFKLKEGDRFTVMVPVVIKEKEDDKPVDETRKLNLNRLREAQNKATALNGGMNMGGGMGGPGMGGPGMGDMGPGMEGEMGQFGYTRIEIKKYDYRVGKIDSKTMNLELTAIPQDEDIREAERIAKKDGDKTKLEELKKAIDNPKVYIIGEFREDETYKVGGREYPMFYEGGMGIGAGGPGMEMMGPGMMGPGM